MRPALDEFHRDVRLPVRLADVVDSADGSVVEGSGCTRLPHESGARRGILEGGGGQELERDIAIEALVMRAIHLAHAARPEHRQDAIVADLPIGHVRRPTHSSFADGILPVWSRTGGVHRSRAPSVMY